MKKLGFGVMRLPMKDGAVGVDGDIDFEKTCEMIDLFLKQGFQYFDTAHGYIGGKSEDAVRECLVKRHPRTSYLLADKLTAEYFQTEADIPALFASQLKKTGVDYFDYYLMHSLTADLYEKFESCHAFELAARFKAEGRISHLGISFHDKPEVLDRILSEHPEIEVVQIQFNYADYDNPSIESGAVYRVCVKHRKPVIVMEPVKGGGLADLPVDARRILEDRKGGSCASYAIRYCASFDNVFMVLSGMSTLAQVADNTGYMKDFRPLTEEEFDAVEQVREILRQQDDIACTACRYCLDGCPKRILIPDLFACYNARQRYKDWNSEFYYENSTNGRGKASDCVNCGKCEVICPQHLPIRSHLKQVAALFENKK